MKKAKFILFISILFYLSGCQRDIVELERMPSPTGQLEAVIYEHRGKGELRILVVKRGEKLSIDRDPDYPNLAIVSDMSAPFNVS